jgi:hypothetical protein
MKPRAALRAMAVGIALVLAVPAAAQPRKPPATGPAAGAASPGAPKPLSQTLTGDAKAAYDAGKLLIGDGDYAGAAIKFKAAFDLSGDPRLLWNIAACEKNQRHYARAMTLVGEYLETGKELLTDADRREARALLDAIQSFTVKLTIVVNEPGADVLVDDERIGTSPLSSPVIVDLGQRRVTARKPGFRDATAQVTVGGSSAARVELALQPEPHQGKLTVSTRADGRISVDGKPVGTGSFQGPLKSGKHTLRVEAEGMRPYEGEVTIADDENRSVDVQLEKESAAATPPGPTPSAPSAPSFEVGVSGGPGIKMHGDNPWVNVVRVDVGVRGGWRVNLGLYAEYGIVDASGACGTDSHGPSPAQPLDLSVRNSFQSCTFAKAGLQLALHILPKGAIDPWIALEPGGRLTFYNFASYDPLDGSTGNTSKALPALDLGARVGADWHPVASFRPWSVGAYASLVYTAMANENPAENAGNDANGPPGVHSSGINAVQYFSVFFGLRSSLAF